ncbi:nucleotidyl transferase AbiEii/AbiGii toxin family protein [Dasania marina]|uniref:nucleotidyl transferase AbiEii/AbiGii toxin family protein n=1 Tax=Dasania marina TaxID=471499 RepID=UPI0030D7E191|tara:strand:- start:4154 stop:4957 length:804 start_codon:yes stop_codon:yes gene_type:complete
MFKRDHHNKIHKVLTLLNADLLLEAGCYFGGGTAIVLSLDEYRESVDIDFLCSSKEGYKKLRNIVTQNSLNQLLMGPVEYQREPMTDRNAIRAILRVDGKPIKIEFVREARIEIVGAMNEALGVPVLSKTDMFAEKLLANADRGLDKYVKSRDIIDIAMMVDAWGDIPYEAIIKTEEAYGTQVTKALATSIDLISNESYFRECIAVAKMDREHLVKIPNILYKQLDILMNQPSQNAKKALAKIKDFAAAKLGDKEQSSDSESDTMSP